MFFLAKSFNLKIYSDKKMIKSAETSENVLIWRTVVSESSMSCLQRTAHNKHLEYYHCQMSQLYQAIWLHSDNPSKHSLQWSLWAASLAKRQLNWAAGWAPLILHRASSIELHLTQSTQVLVWAKPTLSPGICVGINISNLHYLCRH